MAGILQTTKFPVILVISSVFVINLVVNASLPHADGGIVLRKIRSYETQRKTKTHTLENSVKAPAGRSTIFATDNSTVVLAQVGGTATLPCIVRKFNNGVVSWIRKQDAPALLTVGVTTYSSDDRFLVEHVRHLQNWGLLIKHVQSSDAGLYECQVSTHPPTSIFIHLKVTEASAEIVGAPDLHAKSGSSLRLVCTLKQSTEPPAYVFWYHNQRMINYDIGVTVFDDHSSSVLLFEEADITHSGNYTCCPSNAIPASINVHVLNATEEEHPAAMLHANGCEGLRLGGFLLTAIVLFIQR